MHVGNFRQFRAVGRTRIVCRWQGLRNREARLGLDEENRTMEGLSCHLRSSNGLEDSPGSSLESRMLTQELETLLTPQVAAAGRNSSLPRAWGWLPAERAGVRQRVTAVGSMSRPS